jgi:hypothetical protein
LAVGKALGCWRSHSFLLCEWMISFGVWRTFADCFHTKSACFNPRICD